MKLKISLFVALAAGLAMASCSPSLKVTTDYDKTANFALYKTFRIDSFHMTERINQLNSTRLINAVKADLTKKGFKESLDAPDMRINIAIILKDQQTVTANSNYYGYGGYYRPYGWGGGMGMSSGYTTYDVQNYKAGSLIIDIADSKNQKLIWEGIGNKDIEGPAKDPESAINNAVTSIMSTFPPGAAKK